jgi:hypothetical protein
MGRGRPCHCFLLEIGHTGTQIQCLAGGAGHLGRAERGDWKVLPGLPRSRKQDRRFRQGEYGTAQIDGQWYGWFGGRTCEASRNGCYESEIHDYPDLYRVDLDSGTPTLAAHGNLESRGWLVSPTGEVAARASYNGGNGDWRLLAGKAEGQALAGGTSDFGGVGRLEFGRTPDTVLAELPIGNDRTAATTIASFR